MRKQLPISLLMVLILSAFSLSCNNDSLSASDITGIYTAKKIGQNNTFPLTIYDDSFGTIYVEAEWVFNQETIIVELTDDGFRIDTEISSTPIGGTGIVDGDVINISYSVDGGSAVRIIASR